MSKSFKLFISLTVVTLFAFLMAGCGAPGTTPTPAKSATPAAGATPAPGAAATAGAPDPALKDAVAKLADEYNALGNDLKAADSGTAAADVLKKHAPVIKELNKKGKEVDKNKTMDGTEEVVKKAIGEDTFKKFTDAFMNVIQAKNAADEKFKDDEDYKTASKDFEESTKDSK